MKREILLSMMLLSSVAYAKKGPMPHERTDTPKLANSTTGRYMYLGDVPKFEASELEFTISKMNLTARITAHVNQGRIDTYANQLFLRWKSIDDALMDPIMSLHPLVKIQKLAEGKTVSIQAWAKIAEQYSSHILDKSSEEIFLDKRNAKNYESAEYELEYKRRISDAYFKYLFDTTETPDAVIRDDVKLAQLLSVSNSQILFEKHLGHLYTKSAEKASYTGYLTFVYPIAATVDGPFSQPREQVTDLKTSGSIESRWWSDKWNDEFGGFPFLLINWDGVAFHGPITNYSPIDVWFLRRGYVSHGCHRMDGSDILEMRALMPNDLKKAANQIKVVILDHFDVTDWNKDGTLEAIDVSYYNVPTSITVAKGKTLDATVAPYLVENQKGSFLKNNKYAAQFYDAKSDKLKKIPAYKIGKTVVKSGTHDTVDLYRFDYRPNRIIQYREKGIKQQGFDDVSGKYPPKYFQRY